MLLNYSFHSSSKAHSLWALLRSQARFWLGWRFVEVGPQRKKTLEMKGKSFSFKKKHQQKRPEIRKIIIYESQNFMFFEGLVLCSFSSVRGSMCSKRHTCQVDEFGVTFFSNKFRDRGIPAKSRLLKSMWGWTLKCWLKPPTGPWVCS